MAKRPGSFTVIVFVGGFSCFMAWPVMTVLCTSLPGLTADPLSELDVSRLAALGGALAMLLGSLLAPISNRLNTWRQSNALSCALALVMIALSLCEYARHLGMQPPFIAELAVWTFAGVSFALMLLLWGGSWDAYASAYGKKDIVANLLSSVVAAALICLGCAYTLSNFFLIALAAIPIISLASYRYLMYRTTKDTGSASKTMDGIVKLPVRHAFYVVAISSYGSFVLLLCAGTIEGAVALSVGAVAALVACVVLAAIRVLKGASPRFLLVERISFPITVSGALAAPFVDQPIATIVMAFVGVLGTTAFMVAHWELLVKWSYRFKLQPIYHYSYGTFTLAGGFFLGAVACSVVLKNGFLPVSLSATIACLVVLLGIVVISAFSPYDSEPVFDSFEGGIAKTHGQEGIWKATVEAMAERHKLTPREKEILEYLAKGRSVKHISSKLVISEHTTKTHVYRIYKKLDVSSHQELLDIVDDELARTRRVPNDKR